MSYVAYRGSEDRIYIIGVYSTREKAEEVIKEAEENRVYGSEYYGVEEFTTDHIPF